MDAPGDEDRLRVAWGYIPTIEYYPFKDFNLRFYVNWVGRVFNYSDKAEQTLGVSDYNTGRFAIGLVTPLAVLKRRIKFK